MSTPSRTPRLASLIVVAGLWLVACGSSTTKPPAASTNLRAAGGPTTATAPAAPRAAATPAAAKGYQPPGWTAETGPDVTYTLKLASTGFSAVRYASARLTLHVLGSKRQICWSFSKLVGVGNPTTAGLRPGSPGTTNGGTGSLEISFGARYTPNGCTPPIAGSGLQSIVNNSAISYVTVDTARYPSGAIFAQL